jgi:ABC-2 type transport system permease protein
VIALHLAIHLTRTQEAAGRFELLTAGRLGRTAPLVSAMVVLTTVMAATAVLSLLGLLAAGLGSGSAWYAAGLFLLLVSMAALGILVAQVATDGQSAHGLGLLVIGVLFMVRALVDGLEGDPVWLSPLGWFAEIRPFGEAQTWPLPALALLTVALLAVGAVVNVRRDLGSGVVSPRPGPATAPAVLGTPAGLTARLLRGTWLGWTVGSVVWAVVIGAIAREMRELIESNPDMTALLGAQGADPEDLMVAVGGFFVALLALGFVAHAVGRVAAEESSGRLAVVLASPMSRTTWWLGAAGTVLTLAVVQLLLSGAALGVGLWVGTGESASVGTGLGVASAFLTAVVLTGAVCLGLAAVSPRLAGAGWAVFALVMTVDFLGQTLELPDRVIDLSPFEQVGRPPVESADTAAIAVMGLLAAAVLAGSVLAFRRRDLVH